MEKLKRLNYKMSAKTDKELPHLFIKGMTNVKKLQVTGEILKSAVMKTTEPVKTEKN